MEARLQEIDFIKGIAILSVLLLHSLSRETLDVTCGCLHIGQAVPLFFFVTFFLSYKGLETHMERGLFSYYYSRKRINRVLKDIAFPFFIVVVAQIVIRILFDNKQFDIRELTHIFLGVGPGNYYFWVYLQIWMVLPILYLILKRLKIVGVLLILAISITLNLLIDFFQISPALYRLLMVRYLFLSVPAFLLFDRENRNKKRFPQLIIGAIIFSFIYLVYIRKLDLTPYVLDLGWSGEQWPSYFWTYFIFVLLMGSWNKLSDTRFSRVIEFFGRNSWYIFLAQMFLLAYFNINHLGSINNDTLRSICFVLIVIVVSLVPTAVIYLKRIKNEKSMYNPSERR